MFIWYTEDCQISVFSQVLDRGYFYNYFVHVFLYRYSLLFSLELICLFFLLFL